MALLDGLLNIIAPKKKTPNDGSLFTPTFNPQQTQRPLALPAFNDHLNDIFTLRQQSDTRTLLKQMFRSDPDVSSAVNGYLTLANTEIIAWAVDADGFIDPEASKDVQSIITRLTRQVDYTQGFQLKQSLYQLAADLRYMILLRGGIACELVYDKSQNPDSLRNIDFGSIRWKETKSGTYTPLQQQQAGDPVAINTPAFFVSFYRRDPTTLYADSTFVASINTIAARQQVINDLYRIMRQTGFPRITAKLLEEVVIKAAPANVRADQTKLREFVQARMNELRTSIESLSADQSIIHSDSVEFKILNDRNPGAAIDVTSIIETLNAQNQAALKTMATVLGRGANGVNTSSVEARLAAMYADELNEPIAEMFEKVLSFCLHQRGYQGFAVVKFRPAELRPDTELEPQRLLKANRLRQDLSDGIISDEEYTLEMYGRLPLPGVAPLTGTGFHSPASSTSPNPADVSPNSDPLGRSISPDTTKQTKANQPKSVSKARRIQ